MPAIVLTLFVLSILPTIISFSAGYYRQIQLSKIEKRLSKVQQAKQTEIEARVLAAVKSAWESLAFFTAIAVIALVSGLDIEFFSTPAYIFLAARVLHPIFYLLNIVVFSRFSFAVGLVSGLYIFYLSAGGFQSYL